MFCRLADDFQLLDYALESKHTFDIWKSFLSVVLKGTFYDCSYFLEIYSFKEEYGDTNVMLPEETFMEINRGLSCSKTPSDDQRVLNSDYDLEAGIWSTKDLKTWKNLVMELTSLFVQITAAFMIDYDNLETQADAGAMAMEKRAPRKEMGRWKMRCALQTFVSSRLSPFGAEKVMSLLLRCVV